MRFVLDMVSLVAFLIYALLPATIGIVAVILDAENAEKRRGNIIMMVIAIYVLGGIVLFDHGVLRWPYDP